MSQITMKDLSPRDQNTVRIMTARLILQHKPSDISLSAFLIFVRSRLPPASHPTSGKGANGVDLQWLNLVKQLEMELRHANAGLSRSKLELEARKQRVPSPPPAVVEPQTPSSPAPADGPASQRTTNGDKPPKKKKKPNPPANANSATPTSRPTTAHNNLAVEATIEQMNAALYKDSAIQKVPPLMDSLKLITSLRHLFDIADRLTGNDLDQIVELKFDGVRDMIQLLGSTINIAMTRPSGNDGHARYPPRSLFQAASNIFGVAMSLIPGAFSSAQQDEIVSLITSIILQPTIHFFLTASEDIYKQMLLDCPGTPVKRANGKSNRNRKSDEQEQAQHERHIDIRPLALTFLRSLFSTTLSNKISLQLAESASFVATRRLHGIVTQERTTIPRDSTAGRKQRAQRLAEKDAVWYLCSILHTTLPLILSDTQTFHESGREEESESVLKVDVVHEIGKLLAEIMTSGNSSGSAPSISRGMDELEKGMILGVAEIVWLRGVSEDEDVLALE